MDRKTEAPALPETINPEKINFEELVELYGDYLYRQAYLRTGRAETAEDLVQETFLAALQNIKSFQGRSSLKTWLHGILRNKTVDYFRKSGREESVAFDGLDEQRSHDFLSTGAWKHIIHRWEASPEEELEQKGFMHALERCIMGLPDRIRQIFLLKVLENLDNAEICKEMDITATNVWVTIYRARMQLRGCLDMNWYRSKSKGR